MSLIELKNNKKLKTICDTYKLNIESIAIIEDLIVIPTYQNNVYTILDNKLNVLTFKNAGHELNQEELTRLVQEFNLEEYNPQREDKRNSYLQYPLNTLSMKDFITISSIIDIKDNSYVDKDYSISINGFEVENDDNSKYIPLIEFMYILNDERKSYLEYEYQAAMQDTLYLSPKKYLNSIMTRLVNYVLNCLDNNQSKSLKYSLESIGIDKKYNDDIIRKIVNIILNFYQRSVIENYNLIAVQPVEYSEYADDLAYLEDVGKSDEFEGIDDFNIDKFIARKKNEEKVAKQYVRK